MRQFFRLIVVAACLISPSIQRALSITDLKGIFDRLGDEFLTRHSLKTQSAPPQDDDIPHPLKVNNFAAGIDVGQISAVSVNPNDQPVIFHRGHVVWDAKSFGRDYKLVAPTLIGEDTIVTLDADSGKPLSSFGKDLFLMPHGLTVDNEGNIYVTDVGLHQVMRFPPNATKPDMVLGTHMQPGSDHTHFCMPTAVAVAASGDFFVADGYCNSRVMKFNKDGKLIKVINGNWQVPHSLALFEETDVLCVADREGGRVECINAGLQKPLHANRDDTGKRVVNYNQKVIGRPYAIASKGTALLVLRGSPQAGGITIDTATEPEENPIIDEWATSDGIVSPHDLAITQRGDAVYVVEVPTDRSSTKIHKYDVISNNNNAEEGSENNPEPEMGLGGFAF
jgi:peptidylamidoglycolate lyase